jgi:hypothetical protein
MSGVVIFDPTAFVARYPVFSAFNTANPGALQGYFDTATLFLNNTACSIVGDVVRRSVLLNMLVAHLLQLDGVLTPSGSGSTADKVGRLASGSEGTVSAQFAMEGVNANSAYFMQTQYGAAYWAATAPYRTMRYVRGWRRC